MNNKNFLTTILVSSLLLNSGCNIVNEQPEPTRTPMLEPNVNCTAVTYPGGNIPSFEDMEKLQLISDCISFIPGTPLTELSITEQSTQQVMVCMYTPTRYYCEYYDNIWNSSFKQGDTVILPKDKNTNAILVIIGKEGVEYERLKKMAEYLFKIQIRNRYLNPQIGIDFIKVKES